jgi:hypothetical protein
VEQSIKDQTAMPFTAWTRMYRKLATTLASDLATLFSDIGRDLGGKDKEGGKPKPIIQPRGKPVAKLDLSNLSPSERPYAELIAKDFANAGYGRVQQAAAVAAAIAESNLDPTAVGDDGPSIGMFQENRDGGLETEHSVVRLKDPSTIALTFVRNLPC